MVACRLRGYTFGFSFTAVYVYVGYLRSRCGYRTPFTRYHLVGYVRVWLRVAAFYRCRLLHTVTRTAFTTVADYCSSPRYATLPFAVDYVLGLPVVGYLYRVCGCLPRFTFHGCYSCYGYRYHAVYAGCSSFDSTRFLWIRCSPRVTVTVTLVTLLPFTVHSRSYTVLPSPFLHGSRGYPVTLHSRSYLRSHTVVPFLPFTHAFTFTRLRLPRLRLCRLCRLPFGYVPHIHTVYYYHHLFFLYGLRFVYGLPFIRLRTVAVYPHVPAPYRTSPCLPGYRLPSGLVTAVYGYGSCYCRSCHRCLPAVRLHCRFIRLPDCLRLVYTTVRLRCCTLRVYRTVTYTLRVPGWFTHCWLLHGWFAIRLPVLGWLLVRYRFTHLRLHTAYGSYYLRSVGLRSHLRPPHTVTHTILPHDTTRLHPFTSTPHRWITAHTLRLPTFVTCPCVAVTLDSVACGSLPLRFRLRLRLDFTCHTARLPALRYCCGCCLWFGYAFRFPFTPVTVRTLPFVTAALPHALPYRLPAVLRLPAVTTTGCYCRSGWIRTGYCLYICGWLRGYLPRLRLHFVLRLPRLVLPLGYAVHIYRLRSRYTFGWLHLRLFYVYAPFCRTVLHGSYTVRLHVRTLHTPVWTGYAFVGFYSCRLGYGLLRVCVTHLHGYGSRLRLLLPDCVRC